MLLYENINPMLAARQALFEVLGAQQEQDRGAAPAVGRGDRKHTHS